MLFLKDFINKLNNWNENIKDIKGFRVEFVQILKKLGIIIPLLAISVYFVIFSKDWVGYCFAGIIFLLAIVQIIKIFRYKIIIDTKNKLIIDNLITLKISEIETCVLKEMGFKSGVRIVLDIIYLRNNTKNRLIIPLIMNKKISFVYYIKNLIPDIFKY